MTDDDRVAPTLAARSVIQRGTVVGVSDGGVSVMLEMRSEDALIRCDLLEGVANTRLEVGDEVLVWSDSASPARPIVMGRIGPARPRIHDAGDQGDETPETLVLEARHSLTLRVGDGSITIREDGKILIKGKDLISHAQRMNRIKGGAVSIN